MKCSTIIKEYTSARLMQLEVLLARKAVAFTAKDFHDLRLEIKKLRAVKSMLEKVEDKKWKNREFDKIMSLFKKAGEIRDRQLETKSIRDRKNKPLPRLYLQILKEEQDDRREEFNAVLELLDLDIRKFAKQFLQKVGRLKRSEVNKYLQNRVKKVNRQLEKKDISDEVLHDTRKILKELTYVMKAMDMPDQKGFHGKAERIMDRIGNWHDALQVRDSIEKHIHLHQVRASELSLLQDSIIYFDKKAERLKVLAIKSIGGKPLVLK